MSVLILKLRNQSGIKELAVKKSLTIGIEWETTVTKRLSKYNVASIQKPQEGARRGYP